MSTITQWEGVFTHVDENGNKQQMFPEIKTDKTLTLDGKAADAAVTGAMIKKATPVKILKADFEALTEEQKNAGSYLIIDAGLDFPEGGSGASSADAVSYDGSETGLGSNVQEAIDNVDSKLTAGDLKFQFATDGEGNYGYLGADGSLIPFKKEVDLAELTPATATADVLSEGFTAWVNGELIVGTRPLGATRLSGSVTHGASWGQVVTNTITFETPFDTIPTVSLAGSTCTEHNFDQLYVAAVNTNNFTYVFEPGGTPGLGHSTVVINWVAYV